LPRFLIINDFHFFSEQPLPFRNLLGPLKPRKLRPMQILRNFPHLRSTLGPIPNEAFYGLPSNPARRLEPVKPRNQDRDIVSQAHSYRRLQTFNHHRLLKLPQKVVIKLATPPFDQNLVDRKFHRDLPPTGAWGLAFCLAGIARNE
jgi:hypothetical protein